MLAASALMGLSLSACGQGPARGAATGPATPAGARQASSRSGRLPEGRRRHSALASSGGRCPLTGRPAAGWSGHAALAVKVENTPQARPQWGLDQADIVFVEPVEGGITRFVAVYDCSGASRIEPVRSGRFDDPEILEPLGKVLFAYAGAIQPVVNEIDAPTSLLEDVGMFKAPAAYWRDPERVAPHNLVTSTAALYAAAKALGYPEQPPRPIFSYGPPAPGGTPAAQVKVDFGIDTAIWTWKPATGLWYLSYSDTGPALEGDGRQVSASNVVVLMAQNDETPWVEDATGAHEYVLQLKGTGPAWVFRDGRQYYGRWVRPRLADPAVFLEQDGTKVTLSPGKTWEDIVPSGGTGPVPTWTGSVSVLP